MFFPRAAAGRPRRAGLPPDRLRCLAFPPTRSPPLSPPRPLSRRPARSRWPRTPQSSVIACRPATATREGAAAPPYCLSERDRRLRGVRGECDLGGRRDNGLGRDNGGLHVGGKAKRRNRCGGHSARRGRRAAAGGDRTSWVCVQWRTTNPPPRYIPHWTMPMPWPRSRPGSRMARWARLPRAIWSAGSGRWRDSRCRWRYR